MKWRNEIRGPQRLPTHNMCIEILPYHHVDSLGHLGVEWCCYFWDSVGAYPSLVVLSVSEGKQGISAPLPGSTPFVD